MKYIIDLSVGVGYADDIDHLGHRRVGRVGNRRELLQNQFRILTPSPNGSSVIRERMTIQDINNLTPQLLINTRPISSSIDEFFGSSQLSQFMDQVNPLSELTLQEAFDCIRTWWIETRKSWIRGVRDVTSNSFRVVFALLKHLKVQMPVLLVLWLLTLR